MAGLKLTDGNVGYKVAVSKMHGCEEGISVVCPWMNAFRE